MQPYLAMIVPVSNAGHGERPDHSLPGGRPVYPGHGLPEYPIDPGWGGGWGSGAVDPGWGRPIFHPGHPDHGLPSSPGHPSQGPIYGGGHPSQGLPWAPALPDNTLPGAQPKVYAAKVPPTPPESVNTEDGVWVIVNVGGALAWAWAQKPAETPPVPEQQ
jgi:hypothetical protein